jgi:hypothetical protein
MRTSGTSVKRGLLRCGGPVQSCSAGLKATANANRLGQPLTSTHGRQQWCRRYRAFHIAWREPGGTDGAGRASACCRRSERACRDRCYRRPKALTDAPVLPAFQRGNGRELPYTDLSRCTKNSSFTVVGRIVRLRFSCWDAASHTRGELGLPGVCLAARKSYLFSRRRRPTDCGDYYAKGALGADGPPQAISNPKLHAVSTVPRCVSHCEMWGRIEKKLYPSPSGCILAGVPR